MRVGFFLGTSVASGFTKLLGAIVRTIRAGLPPNFDRSIEKANEREIIMNGGEPSVTTSLRQVISVIRDDSDR